MEGQLTKKRYVTLRQFHLQPLLITTLVQSRSQFTVYLMKSADNIIQMFFHACNIHFPYLYHFKQKYGLYFIRTMSTDENINETPLI